MQKVRGHPEGLPLFVGIRFQVLFHPPLGVLFTFPSRYSFTIGHQVVLSLGRWSSQLPPGFHVSQGTQVSDRGDQLISCTGVSPSVPLLSSNFHYDLVFLLHDMNAVMSVGSYNPASTTPARLH